jgi:hypothetical protein
MAVGLLVRAKAKRVAGKGPYRDSSQMRLATPAEKAYAIRDAFDGLLAVMTKNRAENAGP